jgi:VanZ family protein
MFKYLRKKVWNYPLSTFCLLLIWILSLMPFFPETPLDNVKFVDKWTHLLMYGGTGMILWWEYSRRYSSTIGKPLLGAWLLLVAMSGVLELLQEYFTTTRSGEWVDLAANASGVALAAIVGSFLTKCSPSERRDLRGDDCCRNADRQ